MKTLLLGLLLSLSTPFPEDPERRAPDPAAPAHEVFAWTSEEGLRFTWWLPEDYDPQVPANLSVICHGTGLDYRWGHWNNKPKIFRPEDIVISVDGPTPSGAQGDSRLFLGERDDAKAFHAFLEEMRASFSVDRVFLYGHSQGGFFVVYFAGEYPDDVAGVVAHASGAWNWSNTGRNVRKVAVAFMHGTLDPVVPYRQSPASRDHYADAGFELLHLRRLQNYNHWPNAVRANEALGWAQGMTASDPAEALAVARELVRPKKSDEYQWVTVADFSGARDVLRRLVGEGPVPFEELPAELAEEAREAIEAIEEEGTKHVKAIGKSLKTRKLELDGKPWLGHLIALREDFRGVDSVEAFVDELGYDKLLASHTKAAGKILATWYGEDDGGEIYADVVRGIGKAFLFEGYPPELAKKMEAWFDDADDLDISKKDLKAYAEFEAWAEGWEQGLEAYGDVWKKWKGL